MPRARELWADGGDTTYVRLPQPTGDRLLDLDLLLCDATPSTTSVMDEVFFSGEGSVTPAPASLRTLDLKNVHFDIDSVEGDKLSAEAMLKAKLDRLAFLARADVSCAVQAEGGREDRQTATTSPFALITGGLLHEQPGPSLSHGRRSAPPDASRLDATGPSDGPGRHIDTSGALQRWLDEAVGLSGSGERAAAAAAWAYERAAAMRALQAAADGGKETVLGREVVPAEGGRRSPAISSEMSGRVEEHRGALAAGPKTSTSSPRCAVAATPPPAPAKYPSISATWPGGTWHCPASPELRGLPAAPRVGEPPLAAAHPPIPRVGTWKCLVQDVHSLLGCQTQ